MGLSINNIDLERRFVIKNKKDAEWAEAKMKCRLNEETIRMAKEMGLNPRSLIKNIPSRTQKWKAPVNVWIREMTILKVSSHRLKG